MNTAMAPAMKKAGTRQRTTCSRAYQLSNASPSRMALSKRAAPTGMKKASRNAATMPPSHLNSVG
jgi:hypothetical protein